MKETAIIYSWIRNGEEHQKEIIREDFYSMFDGIRKVFEKIGDDEISKKMVEIIPKVEKIFINQDVNETQDIPGIVYTINGNEKLMKIRRCNEIVWSILNKYCTE